MPIQELMGALRSAKVYGREMLFLSLLHFHKIQSECTSLFRVDIKFFLTERWDLKLAELVHDAQESWREIVYSRPYA